MTRLKNPVTLVPPYGPEDASAHFEPRQPLYAQGHLRGAVNLSHWKITAGALTRYSNETLFVVYCAGPHCNVACKAAAKLARLGRPVKKMIGGVTDWIDDGFTLVTDDGAGDHHAPTANAAAGPSSV